MLQIARSAATKMKVVHHLAEQMRARLDGHAAGHFRATGRTPSKSVATGAALVPLGPSHHCGRAIYSVRKAFIGSIDAARLAGRAAVSKATNAISNVPPNKFNGSNGLTPKS